MMKQLLFSVHSARLKVEQLLSKQALSKIANGEDAPADQKELIRWYNKGQSTE